MFQKDLQLTDLVNLEEWQEIQDLFSEALEVTLKTVDINGNPITRISRSNRLPDAIIPKTPSKLSLITKTENIKYPFGLNRFVVPIYASSSLITAYMMIGPVIFKARKEESEYSKEAQTSKVNIDELMDALIEINVFSYNKAYSMVNLIENTFTHMAQTGYHKKRLGEIAPEVVAVDPLFSRYYEEKILSSLLNSCVLALNADSGSVMTVDKNTDMLHIKVASSLDKDIVEHTNIKVGEGIAGLAVKTAQPIILPKDKDKKGLSDKLKRKYIKSSMIMPFKKGQASDIYGVINLNMVRRSVDFSEKDIALVRELVNMASLALVPLSQSVS